MSKTLDLFEYANDGAAQAAYVSSDISFVPQYPPAHSDTYVKATSKYSTTYWPHFSTNPALSLIGGWINTQWISADEIVINQRFHIDLGSAKVIKKIYYENSHNAGAEPTTGVNNFTFWGSNSAVSFAELTYGIDTGWTQITPSQSTFDAHIEANQADPKYITVTNTAAYRYYAFKFADNHGHIGYMGFRHLELQAMVLQCYSEDTIVQQGTYSLKVVAAQDDSLNETLTKSGLSIDLSGINELELHAYASRTGTNIEVKLHDSGGNTITISTVITSADVWTKITKDISDVADADKDDIDEIKIEIIEASTPNTFYVDNFYGVEVVAYPVARLNKNRITGYHCFMDQYLRASRRGLAPLKLPDGTVF